VSSDELPEVHGLATVDVEASLAELARARDRVYYDAEADSAASEAYYSGVAPEQFADLVTRSHARTPGYKPARELYPWVDLQPTGMLRSLYTGQEWAPEELIRADLAIAQARAQELTSRLGVPGARVAAEVQPEMQAEMQAEVESEVEAALPFNCEHVVPQSWFAKKEPMRGDLHHLFACESRCNSFRGNTPYAEFEDFPESPAPGSALNLVRGECGKSEANGFEPAHGKGAAARAVFYFLLRYPGVVQAEEMPPERREMVLVWHEENPVTEWERHRNAAIFERQGNRNPFIDHPELAHSLVPTLP
jgi:endonuclease I